MAPLSLYSDNHTIFRSPKEDKLTTEELLLGKEERLTQFGRAMDELGVNIIFAKSAQAKGRVERMWETLQSRLPVELALDGIKTIAEANDYLRTKIVPYLTRNGPLRRKAIRFSFHSGKTSTSTQFFASKKNGEFGRIVLPKPYLIFTGI